MCGMGKDEGYKKYQKYNIMPIFTTSLEYENSEARWSTNICVRGVMVVKV